MSFHIVLTPFIAQIAYNVLWDIFYVHIPRFGFCKKICPLQDSNLPILVASNGTCSFKMTYHKWISPICRMLQYAIWSGIICIYIYWTKKGTSLIILMRLSTLVYSQMLSQYWIMWRVLPAGFLPWADTSLIKQPGYSVLRQDNHVDTKLTWTPDQHRRNVNRTPHLTPFQYPASK